MKKKILCLFCGLLAMTILTTNVYARELAIADDTVNEEGEYDSVRLVAGNQIVSKAQVNGLSLIAGNEVSIDGTYEYGFYAGNSITVNGTIEKDAFIAGNSILIGDNAKIGRDLFVAGNSIKIATNIERDIHIGTNKIDLRGISIGGDAFIDAEEIIMDEDTVITGKLSYLEDAKVSGLDKGKIGSIETRKIEEVTIKVNFMSTVYEFIVSILASYVVMAVLFYIIPSSKTKLDNLELKFESIAKITAIGLAILFVVPMVCLIAVFTGILTPIALITLCIYAIAIYLGTLLTSYVVGNVINKKLFNNDNKYLSLMVGIIIVRLAILIPMLGFWIGAIALLYGLGLIYKFITSRTE